MLYRTAYLVTSLKDLDAKIIGNYKERTANLNSVMEGLLLGVPQGEDVEVEAEVTHAEKAVEAAFCISSSYTPEINEIYPGTMGSTQGRNKGE